MKAFSELSLRYYQPAEIEFPETTVYIAGYTCYDNVDTQSIIIPGSVETIDDYAFYAMAADEILLGNGIQHIGAYAFYDTEIEELFIPDSVKWLGFEFCQEGVQLTGQPSENCHWETEDEFEERTE